MRVFAAAGFETLFDGLVREIESWRARDASLPICVVTPGELLREEVRRTLERELPSLERTSLATMTEWTSATASQQASQLGLQRLPDTAFPFLVWQVLESGAAARKTAIREAGGSWRLSRAFAPSIQNLLEARVSPEELDEEIVATPDLARRALLETFRDFHSERIQRKFLDRAREEELAATGLRESSERGPILFFGFHELTVLRRELLRICRGVRRTALFVPGPGGAGQEAAQDLLRFARALGAELVHLPGAPPKTLTVREEPSGSMTLEDPGSARLELATHATESAEVRAIAREIRRVVEESGRAFGEILITVGSYGPVAALFGRVFAKAGIPLLDCIGVPRGATQEGRRLLALVRALSSGENGREAETLAFLAGAAKAAGVAPLPRNATFRWKRALDLLREHYFTLFGTELPRDIQEGLGSLSAVFGERGLAAKEVRLAVESLLGNLEEKGELLGEKLRSHVLLVRFEEAQGLRRRIVFHAGLLDRAMPLAGAVRRKSALLARFAFETSSERAILSWSERERTFAPMRNPSGFFVDVASQRAPRSLERGTPELRAAPTEGSRARALEAPLDRTDLELATFLAGTPPGQTDLERLREYPGGEFLVRALRLSEARWRPGNLTSHDGILEDPEAREAVWSRVGGSERAWSPTELETLANCPFAFLLERVLKLTIPLEASFDFSASERGLLFHELHEKLGALLQKEGLYPLDSPKLPRAIAILDEIVAGKERELAREPPVRRSHRRATLAALRDDVAASLASAAIDPSRPVPTDFELRFGFPGAGAPPAFDLGEGETLPLRGRFDRVERTSEALEVVDLKTGPPRRSAGKLASERAGRVEVSLQLPLYLEAAGQLLEDDVHAARFAHATIDHDFREVTYTCGDLERDRGELRALLRHLVKLVREGFFPCRPGTSCCRARLAPACGPSAAERFARKQSDPRLAEHTQLLLALAGKRSSPRSPAAR